MNTEAIALVGVLAILAILAIGGFLARWIKRAPDQERTVYLTRDLLEEPLTIQTHTGQRLPSPLAVKVTKAHRAATELQKHTTTGSPDEIRRAAQDAYSSAILLADFITRMQGRPNG